jgi:hypothetical protein
MEEGSLLERIHAVLDKVEFGGKDEIFKHMKTCPYCGAFGPGQFGTKGIHRPECELLAMKEIVNELLKQTDLDLHRDNMWYKYDTGEFGCNQTLVTNWVDIHERKHSTQHLITTKD